MKWIFFILLPLIQSSQADVSGSLGLIHTQTTAHDDLPYSSIYFRPYATLELSQEVKNYGFKGSLRAFKDFNADTPQDRLEVREFYFNYNTDFWDHRIGAQLLTFSETFGLEILDVANPRDYSDFILNDLEWSKLTTWAWNSTYTNNNYSAQFVWSPYPNKDILPAENSFYDISTNSSLDYSSQVKNPDFFKDSEYGVRLGHLFDNGVDLNILYFKHFNRQPAFELTNIQLHSFYERVDSFGGSFSYALESVVFRGDIKYTLDNVRNKDLSINRKDELNAIVGIDYTLQRSFTSGAQLQYQQWLELYWGSFYLKYDINDYWQLALFYFKGINNDDEWIQPKISLRLGSFILSTHMDILNSDVNGDGVFASYTKKDRIYSNITYEF